MQKEVQDTQKPDPKLSQFTEELNELLARYQYRLQPSLSVTTSGIVPTVSIANAVPPKTLPKKSIKKVKKKAKK